MRIKDISVENYRNLNSATITFDESCNFIVGENNLGKILMRVREEIRHE